MFLITIFHAMQTALRAIRIERELSRLDDRALADMGINRSEILRTAMKMAE